MTDHTPDAAGVQLRVTARKAVTAGVLALVTAVGTAMADGTLTGAELVAGAGLALVTAAGTWQAPYTVRRHRRAG